MLLQRIKIEYDWEVFIIVREKQLRKWFARCKIDHGNKEFKPFVVVILKHKIRITKV